MHRRDRATLDHAGDGLPLNVVELGRLSCRLAIQETVRTAGVEAQHPVPDDLKSDTADLGRLGARRTVIDRRKRQKPSGLRAIFASPGQTPQVRRIKILAYWHRSRHAEPPRFAVVNLTRPRWRRAQESWSSGPGSRTRQALRLAQSEFCRQIGVERNLYNPFEKGAAGASLSMWP